MSRRVSVRGLAAHLRFWGKSGLQLVAPRLFSSSPLVEREPDREYKVLRDRHPVREKHNGQTGWGSAADADGIVRRDYANYDEYVLHQQQKLEEILRAKGGFSRRQIVDYRVTFYSRFRHLLPLLPADAT